MTSLEMKEGRDTSSLLISRKSVVTQEAKYLSFVALRLLYHSLHRVMPRIFSIRAYLLLPLTTPRTRELYGTSVARDA